MTKFKPSRLHGHLLLVWTAAVVAVIVSGCMGSAGVIKIEGETLMDRVAYGPGYPNDPPTFMDEVIAPAGSEGTGPYFGIQDLTFYQPTDQPPLSGGWHAMLWSGVVGSAAEGKFIVPHSAGKHLYNVKYVTLGADDYGVVRVSVDGIVLGEFDCYSPEFSTLEFANLGPIELGPGEHVVRLEIVGNRTPRPYGFVNAAIDYLEFTPAE